MRFASAFNWMKNGKKMMCAGFVGYWYWDKDQAEVIMVTKANEKIPMKNSNNWDFTLGFINSDEWSFYEGPADPRESDIAKRLDDRQLKQQTYPFFPVMNELNDHLFGGEPRMVSLFDGTELTTAPLLVNGSAFDLIGISNMEVTAESVGIFPHDLELAPRLTKVNLRVDAQSVSIDTNDSRSAVFTPNATGDALNLAYSSEARELLREGASLIMFAVRIDGYMKRITGKAEFFSSIELTGIDEVAESNNVDSIRLRDRVLSRIVVESIEIGGELIKVSS